MKKDEKLKMLESSVGWLRDECITLAGSIEKLKVHNRNLFKKVSQTESDSKKLEETIMTLKNHNIVLTRTVEKLKSPEFIEKYHQQGRLQAEQENYKL